MIERDIEMHLRHGIEYVIPGAKCLKLITPGFNGIPDRLILLPGGVVAFAETKKPQQSERQRQQFVQSRLRKLGFTVFSSVDSMEKVNAVVHWCVTTVGGRVGSP